jgi:translation initiation factor IF-2
MILLQAEVLELDADPSLPAEGYVIESELEKGMGATASVLVTEGTLHRGDVILCGETYGKMKALIDPLGQRVNEAGPSHAVKLMGLSDVPNPGDKFVVMTSEKEARDKSQEIKEENRVASLRGPERGASLDDLFAQAKLDDVEDLSVLLKSDVKGSQEAIVSSLQEIKSDKVRLNFIGTGIGPINENDVLLATASNAIIIGFNVAKENKAVKAAKHEGVEIRLYDIIYELIDDVRAAMLGMLQPVQHEKVIATAEIRAMFKLRKKGNVAGCIVTSGRVRIDSRARVLRGKDIIYQGAISTLKRFQDEVKEVGNGQECGIKLQNFDEFEVGDLIEVYVTESRAQEL